MANFHRASRAEVDLIEIWEFIAGTTPALLTGYSIKSTPPAKCWWRTRT